MLASKLIPMKYLSHLWHHIQLYIQLLMSVHKKLAVQSVFRHWLYEYVHPTKLS